MLCGFYVTRLDHISLPLPPYPRLVDYRPRSQTGRSRRGCSSWIPNFDVLQSFIKTLRVVARRDGRVTQVEVVRCERVHPYLRRHSHIYIWGEVRGTLFLQILSHWPLRRLAGSTSSRAYHRSCVLPPNIDVVLRFAVPLCPFSVHRMALAGKELGKEVGQSFGPSNAAGAIRCIDVAFVAA